jgi:hypothetical protein
MPQDIASILNVLLGSPAAFAFVCFFLIMAARYILKIIMDDVGSITHDRALYDRNIALDNLIAAVTSDEKPKNHEKPKRVILGDDGEMVFEDDQPLELQNRG